MSSWGKSDRNFVLVAWYLATTVFAYESLPFLNIDESDLCFKLIYQHFIYFVGCWRRQVVFGSSIRV